jgi:hypothetical protein
VGTTTPGESGSAHTQLSRGRLVGLTKDAGAASQICNILLEFLHYFE